MHRQLSYQLMYTSICNEKIFSYVELFLSLYQTPSAHQNNILRRIITITDDNGAQAAATDQAHGDGVRHIRHDDGPNTGDDRTKEFDCLSWE